MTGYSLMNAGFEDPRVQGVQGGKSRHFQKQSILSGDAAIHNIV